MIERAVIAPECEPTPQGEQILLPSVRPITSRQRLALAMAAPLRAFKPQNQ
jgi:hypothetical protein